MMYSSSSWTWARPSTQSTERSCSQNSKLCWSLTRSTCLESSPTAHLSQSSLMESREKVSTHWSESAKGTINWHRRLLRIALNVKYPKVISNEKLYNITKETPISERIKRRRLALLGHILRLDPDTPAQKALKYYLTPHKRPVGRPPVTWIQLITQDLTNTTKHHNIKTPLNPKFLQKLQ